MPKNSTLISFQKFLMEHCGLENITTIQITNIDLKSNTFSYLVQVRNSPGERLKTQSLKGIFIANTSEDNHSATFVINSGYLQSTVVRDPDGSYPNLDWDELLDSIRIKKLWLNQMDRERYFPKA